MMQLQRILVCAIILAVSGCGRDAGEPGHGHHDDHGWSVTAWGETYEIFAEGEPLVTGQTSAAHTHVTVLADFLPLTRGTVTAILAADGREQRFVQDSAARDGIFSVRITPDKKGVFALTFEVASDAGTEIVACGVVRVEDAAAAAAASHEHGPSDGDSQAQTVTFLKEQQWRTAFRTQRVGKGAIGESVRGPARVRASAGSEAIITAPLDGLVEPRTRVHVGMQVSGDGELLRLAPRAPANVNLAELESDLELARSRLERLESLLELGAVSRAEVEAARARVAGLEPRIAAAHGQTGAGSIVVRAPFAGRVAEVNVIPGQAVTAGDALLRFIRVPPVWVELHLRPGDAQRLQGVKPSGLIVSTSSSGPVEIAASELSLISVSPEVDAGTGTVTAILEVKRTIPVAVGTSVEAVVILEDKISGVVIPASAIVDDAGVAIVYEQVEGETFARREVDVQVRQGDRVLVRGLKEHTRVVTVGGAAIRRADIMSSGEVEGHVH